MAEGRCEAEEVLVVKRGATSTIWNWFGYRKSDAEQTTVICKICRKTVVTKSGNTSNFFPPSETQTQTGVRRKFEDTRGNGGTNYKWT